MVVRAPGNTVEFKSFNSRLYAADQPLRRSRTLDGDTGEAIDLNSTVCVEHYFDALNFIHKNNSSMAHLNEHLVTEALVRLSGLSRLSREHRKSVVWRRRNREAGGRI